LAVLGLALPAPAVAADIHVSAMAHDHGTGSSARPFDSLARAERASRRGDRILVHAAPRTAAPLDGGIALKPGQRLIGLRARGRVGRVTNTSAEHQAGDAVTLADRTLVRGLEIPDARRGAIHGENVTGVRIEKNVVTGHNTACVDGFHIQPFLLPSMVPGVGIPISGGLSNAWAAIMVDADRARGRVVITGNRVQRSACGDGIDVRLDGRARIDASLTRNVVSDLDEGEGQRSVLALGLQALGHSRLNAELDRNRQERIGNVHLGPPLDELGNGLPLVGADSEGVFANIDDEARFEADVSRNEFREGLGGFSANGMEMVITGGSPTAHMTISRSRFIRVPGDILEVINFGLGASMTAELDRVVAHRSTGIGNTYVLPGNNGDCLVTGQSGARNDTRIRLRRVRFTSCAGNGMLLGSNVVSGSGPAGTLDARISDSVISGNRGYGIRVGNLTRLGTLRMRMADTTVTGNAGVANLGFDDIGGVRDAIVDIGGGRLGSRGGNCIQGNAGLDADVIGLDVDARHNWWGRPAGPGGRAVAVGGALRAGDPLGSPPRPGC
jgi:hypothetical protein